MIVIFTVLRLIVQVICHALVIAAETRGHRYKFVQLIAGFGQAFHKLGHHLRGLSLPPLLHWRLCVWGENKGSNSLQICYLFLMFTGTIPLISCMFFCDCLAFFFFKGASKVGGLGEILLDKNSSVNWLVKIPTLNAIEILLYHLTEDIPGLGSQKFFICIFFSSPLNMNKLLNGTGNPNSCKWYWSHFNSKCVRPTLASY